MRYILFLLGLLMAFGTVAREVTALDQEEGNPLAGVSVVSSNGVIVGFTDDNGQIRVNDKDYPLSLRCLGYEAVNIEIGGDTIRLQPAQYRLKEFVITPGERPIMRVVAYAREYCTGATKADTMQLFNEYMVESFFADGKVKGYKKGDKNPRMLNKRSYGRIANSRGLDSLMCPRVGDDIDMLSFSTVLSFPEKEKRETDAMLNGASADTVQGKWFPKYKYRKSDNIFTIDCDFLADEEDHKVDLWIFKLLGLTMVFEKYDYSLAYRPSDTGKYGITDFLYSTYNLHILGKGKMLRKIIGVKDNIDMDCFMELYPVKIEHMSVEDYKVHRKLDIAEKIEPFVIPDYAQPLPPAVTNLVDRVNLELPRGK